MADDLSLEKLKISDRLYSVESQFALLNQKLADSIVAQTVIHNDLAGMIHKHEKTLYGNGIVGLTAKSLQNSVAIDWITKALWALATVTFTLGAKAVLEYAFRGMGN